MSGARAASVSAWKPGSKRTGALALKVGMIPVWDSWGEKHAVTVLQLDACQVVQVKTDEVEGYTSLQVGVGEVKDKNVNKPMGSHFKKHGVPAKRKLKEFRVTADAILPSGTTISAAHFVPGQLVDITGTSKGKGFQGVMKRHGFAGGPASHGNSLSHRSQGSTGMCQDPGKVWKNKRMAGRMGGTTQTIAGLHVYKVELDRNLVYVKGAIPGPPGNFVEIKDSRKQHWSADAPPPFPTASEADIAAKIVEAKWVGKDGEEKVRREILEVPSSEDPWDYENKMQPFKGFN